MTHQIKQRWVLVSKKDKDLGAELKDIYDRLEPRVENKDGSWTGPLGFLEARQEHVKPFVLPLGELAQALHERMGYGKDISIAALKTALKDFVKDPDNNFTMIRGRNGGVTRYLS